MNWQSEFPDFPANDMPPIPDGWKDSSWHNDAAPSFFAMEAGEGDTAARYEFCRVWVQEAEAHSREFADSLRFMVSFHGAKEVHDALQTDDWNEVLAYIEPRRELATRYAAKVGYNPFLDDPTIDPETIRTTIAEIEAGETT